MLSSSLIADESHQPIRVYHFQPDVLCIFAKAVQSTAANQPALQCVSILNGFPRCCNGLEDINFLISPKP